LILLLDLDNTILHSSPLDISKEEYDKLKLIYDWEIAAIAIKHPINPKIKQRVVLKLRPGLREFLESISEKYEIYTYTHGTKDYATEIMSYINRSLDKTYLSIEKLIARESLTNIEHKTIKKVFPTTEDMVVIVDDRRDVWVENKHNLINLKPYVFFYDERLLKIKEKYLTKDEDNVLYSIRKFLEYTNSIFYSYFQLNNSRLDVKEIIEIKMDTILNGLNFTCSGIFLRNEDTFNTWINYQIDRLGGILWDNYEDDEVDIVLTQEFKSNYTNSYKI
jgi:FCP1-like phosphatase family protein